MRKLFPVLLIIILTLFVLNVEVSTLQGINYRVQTLKIPLYLKLLDFFDRHYNYGELVKRITLDAKTDEEKIMKIFGWTHQNIRMAPEGLPVIDDHVWHIIIRGYGANDQLEDVFTTLCNYAGLNSFFAYLYDKDTKHRRAFSFVKLKNEWSVFNAYRGVYFIDSKGKIASIQDLFSDNWKIISAPGESTANDYAGYFNDLGSIKYENYRFSRASVQSPLKRFIFWMRNNGQKIQAR